MVTASLPSLTDESEDPDRNNPSRVKRTRNPRHSIAYSVSSELTITPERYTRTMSSDDLPRASAVNDTPDQPPKTSALAGFVGLFTGCGALVALVLFLPLPTKFGEVEGVTPAEAVSYSFYVVGVVALVVSVLVFLGFRHLKGEEGKGWKTLWVGKREYDLVDGVDGDGEPRRQSEVRSCPFSDLYRVLIKTNTCETESDPLSTPIQGLRLPRLHGLKDRTRLRRRLRRPSLHRGHLYLHPALRQHIFHEQRFLPGLTT
jgi:hypothetical protein